MSLGRSEQGLSNDHIAMMVPGCIALGVLFAKRESVLAAAGNWLRDHQLLTDHNAIITIPHLGGLDLARILILTGTLVVCWAWRHELLSGVATTLRISEVPTA